MRCLFGSMQRYAVEKIDQLVIQHGKEIILYDLETKTIKGLEPMKFLNMKYLTDSVWCFSLDRCKVMQLAKSIS